MVGHRSAFGAGAVLALLVLAGCGGGGSTQPSGGSPAGRPAGGATGHGKQVAQQHGCLSCHSLDGSSSVGPTWKGLAGSQVKLTSGKTVKADDRYLRTAIEDPDRQIVAGYQRGVMTNVIPAGSISNADARALVGYIKSLR
jgi:cytochrome c oxidase subunit 2